MGTSIRLSASSGHTPRRVAFGPVVSMQDVKYSIGRFAKMTSISAAALRIYDREGLLKPATVDAETGYRHYTAGQLDRAQLIHVLRKLDVPLREIRELLECDNPEHARAVLKGHEARLHRRLQSVGAMLDRLENALGPDHALPPGPIALATDGPRLVVSRRAYVRVSEGDVRDYNHALFETTRGLARQLASSGIQSLGREIVLHHNQARWYEGLDIEICLPVPWCASLHVDDAWVLPAATVATTRHLGPWSEVWSSYASLLAWMDREHYEPAGAFRATYVVDERDTTDSSRYVADIRVPVESTQGPGHYATRRR